MIEAFENLNAEDQAEYVAFIERIKRGRLPTIVSEKEKYSFNKGESIDLYSLIKITDNEDFAIESNGENVSVITELDASVAGKYKVLYSVKDSDGNKVLKTISVEIIDKTQENPDTLIVAVIIASLLVILFVSAIVLLKVLKKRETK